MKDSKKKLRQIIIVENLIKYKITKLGKKNFFPNAEKKIKGNKTKIRTNEMID